MPSTTEVKYIYELPYYERKVLCSILDQLDSWEELGGKYMNFDMITLQTLRLKTMCGRSPTDALLWQWSQQNHTVVELFVLLSRMQHYQAMLVLKPFVPQQYHRLVFEGEENLGRLFAPSNTERGTSLVTDPRTSPSSVVLQGQQEMRSGSSSGASEARGGSMGHTTDKNLRIDSRNMNVSAARADMPSKVLLPAQPEPKILNTQQQPQQQQQQGAQVPEPQPPQLQLPQLQLPRKGSTGSDVSSLVENCASIPMVDYVELECATNGWSRDSILGKGGFGTVFKGIWNNTAVAVKRLEQREAAADSREQDQLLLRELCFPNSCRHDNVLPIYGVSLGGPSPCLVYQFMANGSVEDRLLCRGRTPPLTWVQRLKIAEGTALGLQFLHTRPVPVVHGDIKSANILLGAEFEPRIADFGLAREGPHSNYTHVLVSRVHGTRPYLPEEFLRSRQFSAKVDTYSFGVVLFELATGLRAYQDDRQHKFLKDHVEACDVNQLPQLLDRRAPDEDCGVFMGLAVLGRRCVERQPRKRPDMVGVLQSVRDLVAATEPLRIQHQLMQQSRAASSLAYYEYVTRRGSSPQPFMVDQAMAFTPVNVQGGFLLSPCPVAQLSVHREEEEEQQPAPPSLPAAPQDCGPGGLPRFSVLLSLKQDSEVTAASIEPAVSNLRLSEDSCVPVDHKSKEKMVDL